MIATDNSLEITQPQNKADWDAFLVKVNKSLDHLDLEFRHLLDESSGKEMYGVVGGNFHISSHINIGILQVNRKGDHIAQMATDYTPAEIAYFKAIVRSFCVC